MKKILSVMGLSLLLAACGDAYESKTIRDLASMPRNSEEAVEIQNQIAKMNAEDREYIGQLVVMCTTSFTHISKIEKCNIPLSQLLKERKK